MTERRMVNIEKVIEIKIEGLGVIMYSDFAVSHIKEGEDYFSTNYQTSQQVLKHIYEGTIVGFCTSSPGQYNLIFRTGYPSELELESSEFKLRLAIDVRDGRICIRDLYDLMDWRTRCPNNQYVEIENGFYHITLCGNTPQSGILGDNQEIYVYLCKLDSMPTLKYAGVPIFCE